MPPENTVLFGIPIPSTNPLFLAGVGIHVLFGLAAIVTTACAMLLHKGRGRHSNFGIAYFWCLFGVFVTMSALAFSRWQEDYDLFILGALSFQRCMVRSHYSTTPLASVAPLAPHQHGSILHLDDYGLLRG